MTDRVVSVRPATEMDAPAVATIHAQSWRSSYRGLLSDAFLDGDVESERQRVWGHRFATLSADNMHVVLAEEAGRPVGFACVLLDPADPRRALLDNVHVVPDRRSAGIGRRLMAAAAAWVVEHAPGASLHLWVFAANSRARALYTSLGGQERETVDLDVPDGRRLRSVRCEWPDPAALVTKGDPS